MESSSDGTCGGSLVSFAMCPTLDVRVFCAQREGDQQGAERSETHGRSRTGIGSQSSVCFFFIAPISPQEVSTSVCELLPNTKRAGLGEKAQLKVASLSLQRYLKLRWSNSLELDVKLEGSRLPQPDLDCAGWWSCGWAQRSREWINPSMHIALGTVTNGRGRSYLQWMRLDSLQVPEVTVPVQVRRTRPGSTRHRPPANGGMAQLLACDYSVPMSKSMSRRRRGTFLRSTWLELQPQVSRELLGGRPVETSVLHGARAHMFRALIAMPSKCSYRKVRRHGYLIDLQSVRRDHLECKPEHRAKNHTASHTEFEKKERY